MKQLLFAIAIVMVASLSAYAQKDKDYDRQDTREAQGANRTPAANPSDVRAAEEREQRRIDREQRIKDYMAVTGNSREDFERAERLAAAREAAARESERKERETKERTGKETREGTEPKEPKEPRISSSADKPEKN